MSGVGSPRGEGRAGLLPRLFTGLEIPHDVAFALSLKKGGLPGARWIDKENYHITLRYVGDVDNRTANEVVSTLDRFAGFEGFRASGSTISAPSAATSRAPCLPAPEPTRPSPACRRRRNGPCSGSACRRTAASSRRTSRWPACGRRRRANWRAIFRKPCRFRAAELPGRALRALFLARIGRRRSLSRRAELTPSPPDAANATLTAC